MFSGITAIVQHIERRKRDELDTLHVIDTLFHINNHVIATDYYKGKTIVVGDTYPIRAQLESVGFTWNRDKRFYEKSGRYAPASLGLNIEHYSTLDHGTEYILLSQRCGHAPDWLIGHAALEAYQRGLISYDESWTLRFATFETLQSNPHYAALWTKMKS